jgi:hypothetical protein
VNERARRALRLAPTVHTRVFDGELVILDLAKGEYLSLDPVGTLLWRGLETGRTIADVARDVVTEYEVTLEQATSDLEELAQDFVARGLFIADGASK